MAKQLFDQVSFKTRITCRNCGATEDITMHSSLPERSFTCKKCTTVLLAHSDECCVYCSYGSVQCPPVQEIAKRLGHL